MIRTVLTTCGPQPSPAAWDAALARLPHAEQFRLRRFRRWQDAQSSLIGRVLMARLVADLLNTSEPNKIDFARDASGRPYLQGADWAGVDINIAHAAGYVAGAISNVGRIGVDVEAERAVQSGLVKRVFAPAEQALLEHASPAEQRSRFFQLWTLKEAFVKALGTGLALDPRTINFDLQAGQLRLAASHASGDISRWRFRSWQPSPGVWLAVCAEHCIPPAQYEELSV